MCTFAVPYSKHRPAAYNPNVAVGEQKIHCVTGCHTVPEAEMRAQRELAEQDRRDPIKIGGNVYPRTVIVPSWRETHEQRASI